MTEQKGVPQQRERSKSPGRPIVFLTRRIPDPGPQLLDEAFQLRGNPEDRSLPRPELLSGVKDASGIVCLIQDCIDAEVMEAAGPELRLISNYGVGYDNIDVAAASVRGIAVTNTPGVLTETTADLSWALILATTRRLAEGDRLVRSGQWRGWEPRQLLGWDTHGKTLGVVGMGRIGSAVARRAQGFDMRVLYTRRSGALPDNSMPAGARWEYRAELQELLAQADIVSLHVPYSAETRHLLGSRELGLMRPHSILINTSRGPVVDERALVQALVAGRPAAAGLDVYEDEPQLTPGLAERPNTVLLPHLGSATHETRTRMAEVAAGNAVAALGGLVVTNAVNPEVLRDGRLPVR